MSLDTVEIAAVTPDREQPFAELGLKPDEYVRISRNSGPATVIERTGDVFGDVE
jgi:hypothetical protein